MLPDLVRRQILAVLRDDEDHDSYDEKPQKVRRANYACVSLEWQEFFEAANFLAEGGPTAVQLDEVPLPSARAGKRESGTTKIVSKVSSLPIVP